MPSLIHFSHSARSPHPRILERRLHHCWCETSHQRGVPQAGLDHQRGLGIVYRTVEVVTQSQGRAALSHRRDGAGSGVLSRFPARQTQ